MRNIQSDLCNINYKPVVEVARDTQCCVHTRDKLSRTDTQMDTQIDGQIDKYVRQ